MKNVYAAAGRAIRRFDIGTPEMRSQFEVLVHLFVAETEQQAEEEISALLRERFPESDGWGEYKSSVIEGEGPSIIAALLEYD